MMDNIGDDDGCSISFSQHNKAFSCCALEFLFRMHMPLLLLNMTHNYLHNRAESTDAPGTQVQ